MATQPQVTAGGPRQLLLVAALVAVLLLIVGLLVVRPMLGGTDEAQPSAPAATVAAAAPTTTTPQLSSSSTSATPSASAVAAGKDPFRPLVSTGAAAGVAATGDGSVTPSTLAAPGSTVAGAGAGTATTPGGGTSAERQVALVSITGGTAKVTVDGKAYTVSEGERFASDYRATDINSECASFESGTTSFTLCEGEAVLK
jgi:cytoskeletal protein RodZ